MFEAGNGVGHDDVRNMLKWEREGKGTLQDS